MTSIPNLENKVEALKIYLQANEEEMSREGWTYGHEPVLIEFFNSLKDSDWKELTSKIWNWSEKFLYNIADAVLFSEVENLEENYIYCRIFLESKNIDNSEYLLENMYPNSGHSIDFYEKILKKVRRLNKKSDGGFDFTQKYVEKKLAEAQLKE